MENLVSLTLTDQLTRIAVKLRVTPEIAKRINEWLPFGTRLYNYAIKTGITTFDQDINFNDDGSVITDETPDVGNPTENLRAVPIIDSETNTAMILHVTEVTWQRLQQSAIFREQLLQYSKTHGITIFNEDIDFVEQSSHTTEESSTSAPTPSPTTGTSETSTNTLINNGDNSEHKWNDDETMLLIETYRKHKDLFKGKQNDAWRQVTQDMNSVRHDENLPPIPQKKVQTRMETLKRKYKEVKDKRKQSGSGAEKWKWFELMDELFSEQPWVKPISVAGSGTSSEMGPTESKKRRRSKISLVELYEQEIEDRRERHEKHDKREEIRDQTRAAQHSQKMRAIDNLTNVLSELVRKTIDSNKSNNE